MHRRKFNKTILTSLGSIGISHSLLGVKPLSPKNKKLGIALVGLGNYATKQLGPALLETSLCELKAIVTGLNNSLSFRREIRLLNSSNRISPLLYA